MRRRERPQVTIHFAQTLDGRIALDGARAAISSPEGIVRAHRARAEHDAVLVGARTVEIDDPRLTVRACPMPEGAPPRRVVLASTLAIARASRLFAERAPAAGALIVIGVESRADDAERAYLAERGAEAIVVPADERGWVSLPHALAALAERGVARLLVEGGARVITSFLRAKLADRAEVEIAPRFLGGGATAAIGELAIGSMAQSIALRDVAVEAVGANVLVRGEVVYAP